MFVEKATLIYLMPEIFLVLLATWIFVGGTFGASRTFWTTFAVLSYVVAGVALARLGMVDWDVYSAGDALTPSGPIARDLLAYIVRWVVLLMGGLLTLMVAQRPGPRIACEVLGLIMLATAGAMLVVEANELVLMFLGLELVSIPTYVLLFVGRADRASAEATAKYFYLSIFSSAMLLYGFSFLYGMTGTTTLVSASPGVVPAIRDQLAEALAAQSHLLALGPVALVMIFAGLGFKMAAVPFHFYAPDVYQGTTNVNAGLLSVLPKIAGAVALVRVTVAVLPPGLSDFVWQLTLVLAVLTMTIGNVCALWQTNVRRMMGYSSIANAGFMLIGLTVALAMTQAGADQRALTYGGVAALVFYLVMYVFGALGTFATLAHLSSEEREISTIDELAGLNKTKPMSAALLAIFFFSQAGIPPLAGFWGKLAVFVSAVGFVSSAGDATLANWFIALAVIGVLNAAVGAAYYLRVIGAMYFASGSTTWSRPGTAASFAAAAVCAVVVVALGIMPLSIFSGAQKAEQSIMAGHAAPRAVQTADTAALPRR